MSVPRRSLPLAIALLTAAAGVASSRFAEQAPSPTPSPAPKATLVAAVPAQATPSEVPTASVLTQPDTGDGDAAPGMIVFKDPKTGALRQGDPAEVKALLLKAAKARRDRGVRTAKERAAAGQEALGTEFDLPGGGVALLLDESYMSTLVATVGPDGRVSIGEGNLTAASAGVRQGRSAARPQEERE